MVAWSSLRGSHWLLGFCLMLGWATTSVPMAQAQQGAVVAGQPSQGFETAGAGAGRGTAPRIAELEAGQAISEVGAAVSTRSLATNAGAVGIREQRPAEDAPPARDTLHPTARRSLKTLDAAASAKFALASVLNESGFRVAYRYRWGNGQWSSGMLDNGASVLFYYTYESGSSKSPSLYLEWDRDTYEGWQNDQIILQRYAAPAIDQQFATAFRFYPYEYNENRSAIRLENVVGETYPPDWAQVIEFDFEGRLYSGIYVRDVTVLRRMNWKGNWDYKIFIDSDLRITGCPFGHRVGEIRARIEGPDGGFLDTGTINHHSGPYREVVFNDIDPGNLTKCTIWASSWCEAF